MPSLYLLQFVRYNPNFSTFFPGNVYALRAFALTLAVLMMFFVSMSVKYFLARPIPYRPLTKEARNPCNPEEYKAKVARQLKEDDDDDPEKGPKIKMEVSSNGKAIRPQ